MLRVHVAGKYPGSNPQPDTDMAKDKVGKVAQELSIITEPVVQSCLREAGYSAVQDGVAPAWLLLQM